jgi:hypothetical protein
MVSKTSPLSTPIADIGADILFRRLGPEGDIGAGKVVMLWSVFKHDSAAAASDSPIQVDGHTLAAEQRASWNGVFAFVTTRVGVSNMEDIRLRLTKVAP